MYIFIDLKNKIIIIRYVYLLYLIFIFHRLEANIRSVSYCTVAEQNDRQLWNRLWELYTQSTFSAIKSIILQSLSCATEDVLLKE